MITATSMEACNHLEAVSQASLKDSVYLHSLPRLASHNLPSNIVVRNTFIHVDSDDEDEEVRLCFSKTRTEPAHLCGKKSLVSFEAWEDMSVATSEVSIVSTEVDTGPRPCSPMAANLACESVGSLCSATCFEVASGSRLAGVHCSSTNLFLMDDFNVVVRNTFIDVDVDDDLDDKPVFDKVKSEPAWLTVPSISMLSEDETHVEDDVQSSVWSFSRRSTRASLCHEDEGAVAAESVQGTHTHSTAQETAHTVVSHSSIVPEADRQPEYSDGAALHEIGHCKPCAWFWRPQGCSNGSECRHCHMCERGELKKVKKANVQLSKQGCKQNRRQNKQAKVVASDTGAPVAACFAPGFVAMMPRPSMSSCQ